MTDPQTDTSLWRLWLKVGARSLSALMTGPESVEQSVRFAHTEIHPGASPLKALEEAVYATPMLPADFAAVTVMADVPAFALLPTDCAAEAGRIVRTLNPEAPDSDEVIVCPPFGLDGKVTLAMLLEAEKVNFLRRTFANPSFTHPLQAAGNYLSHVNKAAGGDLRRAYALLADSELLMFVFGGDGSLRFANRFAIGGETDASYFILAALPPDCPLMVGGPHELRNAVADRLRDYADPVIPLTLGPNLLHLLGHAPAAPLDLLMLTQSI